MSEAKTEILGTENPKDDIQEKINEISTVTTTIKTGLQSFKERKAELEELVKEAKEIKITSIDQKELIEKAGILRKKIKKERVRVENDVKELRKPMNGFNDFISLKGKELLAIVVPVEEEMEKQEAWVQSEYDRIAKEEEDRKQAKFQERIVRLKEYGQTVEEQNREAISAMTDEGFEELVKYAKGVWEKDQAEKKRLADEQKAKEEQARKDAAELENLRKERIKIIAGRTKARIFLLESMGFKLWHEAYYLNHPFKEEVNVSIHVDEVKNVEDETWNSFRDNVKETLEEWNEDEARWKKAIEEIEERNKKIEARYRRIEALGMVKGSTHFMFGKFGWDVIAIEGYSDEEFETELEQSRKAIATLKEEEQKKRQQEIEQANKDAVTKALKEKEEQDRIKRDQEVEKLAQATDSDKLLVVIANLRSVSAKIPEMKSKKNKRLVEELKAKIENLTLDLQNSISKVQKVA